MLEFMNIGPHFGLPWLLVDGRLAAAGATGVQTLRWFWERSLGRKFDENAAHFLDIFVLADQVFVPKQVIEAQFPGLALGLGAGVERAVFSPQLLGGVAGHPKRFFVGHPICPRRFR